MWEILMWETWILMLSSSNGQDGFHSSFGKGKVHMVALPVLSNFLFVQSFMALAYTLEGTHRYYHPYNVLGKLLSSEF